MGGEIYSPEAVTFSFRRTIHREIEHHPIGDVHAGIDFLQDRIRSAQGESLRIDVHAGTAAAVASRSMEMRSVCGSAASGSNSE